jgi:hypothetical protein
MNEFSFALKPTLLKRIPLVWQQDKFGAGAYTPKKAIPALAAEILRPEFERA